MKITKERIEKAIAFNSHYTKLYCIVCSSRYPRVYSFKQAVDLRGKRIGLVMLRWHESRNGMIQLSTKSYIISWLMPHQWHCVEKEKRKTKSELDSAYGSYNFYDCMHPLHIRFPIEPKKKTKHPSISLQKLHGKLFWNFSSFNALTSRGYFLLPLAKIRPLVVEVELLNCLYISCK